MGREIQECILHHINSHRAVHGKNRLELDYEKCNGAQKDAQFVLESMLRGDQFWQCAHKNPWHDGYCHEVTSCGYSNGSFDATVQNLIWNLLSSNEGHRESLLDLPRNGKECNHSHTAAEIAYDSNSGLAVLTIRLYGR